MVRMLPDSTHAVGTPAPKVALCGLRLSTVVITR